MKVRAPIKILIGFLAILGAFYYGKNLYAEMSLRKDYPPLKPGVVNLLGIDTRAGYRIVVANRVAQLVLGSTGEFETPEERGTDTEDSVKKRVPIREMLAALGGDVAALSIFVMKLNDIREDDFSPTAPIWTEADLRKAFDGDPKLASKLVNDLNIELDGTPLDVVSLNALESGIIIECPVPVAIKGKAGAPDTNLAARVREAYQPRFTDRVRKRYEKKNPTREMIAGFYREEAQKILDGEIGKEDIRRSIEARIDKKRLAGFADAPQRVLNSVQVIVSGNLMLSAEVGSHEASDGRSILNLAINLSDEGRDRLWQYSRGRVGTQLLLVWNGVAVAAPAIDHELSDRQVTITQLEDEEIVNQVAQAIGSRHSGDKSQ